MSGIRGPVQDRLALRRAQEIRTWMSSIYGRPAATLAGPHNILSVTHTDTVANAVTRGSLIYGNATPAWDELVLGGLGAGSIVTRDANDVLWSAYALVGTAAQTYTFPPASATLAGGTGAANQVAYWSGANTLTSSGSFLYTMAATPNFLVTTGDADQAIQGTSATGIGVGGTSTSFVGVRGISNTSYGVQGQSTSGDAVYGTSASGNGVHGTSGTGRSGYFYRNNVAGTAVQPVVSIVQDSAVGETNTVLYVQGDGTGDLLNIFDGASEVVTILDGGNVGINETAPDELLHITSSTSLKPVLKLENTNGDALPAMLEFYKNSATPADDDFLGLISFYGEDSIGTKTTFSYLVGESLDVTNGDEAGGFTFSALMEGVNRNLLALRGYNGSVNQGTVVVNDDGQDVDFYVEASGVADAFFVRGSDGQITLGALGAGYLSTDAGGVVSSTVGTPVIGGGSGAANRVAYWSDANTLTSDAGLTVDAAGNGYVVADDGYVGITGDVRTVYDSSSGYIVETLGDAAGADEWRVNDSGGANVANIDSDGNTYLAGIVGVGTTSPVATFSGVDISSGGLSLIVGADSAAKTRTDNANKDGRVGAFHYDNDEEPMLMIYGATRAADNILTLGGGSALLNAATEIRFYTAANTTTLTGTERMRVESDGNVGIGTTTASAQLHVDQSSATSAQPVLLLDQADLSEEFIEFTSTVGAGNPIDTAALGAYYGKVRVNITGVGYKWMALYD